MGQGMFGHRKLVTGMCRSMYTVSVPLLVYNLFPPLRSLLRSNVRPCVPSRRFRGSVVTSTNFVFVRSTDGGGGCSALNGDGRQQEQFREGSAGGGRAFPPNYRDPGARLLRRPPPPNLCWLSVCQYIRPGLLLELTPSSPHLPLVS